MSRTKSRSGSITLWLIAGVGVLGVIASAGLALADADKRKDVRRLAIIERDEAGSTAAYLGVHLTEETEHAEGGARITEVVDDSPASRGGLREGDVIVRFGANAVRGPAGLSDRIRASQPEDRVTLGVLRDGREMTVEVELGERPTTMIWAPMAPMAHVDEKRLAEMAEQFKQQAVEMERMHAPLSKLRWLRFAGRARLGVQLVDTTAELREHLGADGEAGVLVSKVLSGTPAEKAGLRVGDVIVSVDGTAVTSSDALRELVEAGAGRSVDIGIVRDRRRSSVRVNLEEIEEDEPTGPRALGFFGVPAPPPALHRLVSQV